MVKLRDLDTEIAAKVEQFGNDAVPKKSRAKPKRHYKSINIPFTEHDYNRLVAAADQVGRRPTDFIKTAIKQTVNEVLSRH
jgi:hypothetical protein